MTNPHGTPIWYELQATDAESARAFYQAVVGWTIPPRGEEAVDYRMIATPDGHAGGLAGMAEGQRPSCIRPGWQVYFGVDDVDASAAQITAAGGTVHLPPADLPGVGRIAFASDPQGISFYVMRGATEGATSTAWSPDGLGKCNWNELVTPDQEGAHAFYAQVFGWRFPDRMAMPALGDYVFVDAAGQGIGATMTQDPSGQPSGWHFYFRVADIDAAAEAFAAHGGTVFMGPMEVPGGDRILFGADPGGAPVGLVGPGVPA